MAGPAAGDGPREATDRLPIRIAGDCSFPQEPSAIAWPDGSHSLHAAVSGVRDSR